MGRAPCCDKAKVKRGPWSPDEDAALRSYIEKHGTGGNWIALPQKAGLKRCGKSCRLRWLNYLRPDIKHGGFTEEEDNAICTLYSKLGSRWSVIASHLPGRTDNDVKNYWNTKLKKKMMARQVNLLAQITSNSRNHINYSQSPTPPPPPPPTLLPAMKDETYAGNGFFMPLDSNSLISQDHSNKLMFSELAPFSVMMSLMEHGDMSGSINGQVVSPPSEEASATSSTSFAVDHGSGSSSNNSYINWHANGASADEMFLSQLGFGDAEDFYACQEKLGEVSPCYFSSLANMWATTETKPQGLFQGLTNS